MRRVLLSCVAAATLAMVSAALRVAPGRAMRCMCATPRRKQDSRHLTLPALVSVVSGIGFGAYVPITCLTRASTVFVLGRILGLDPTLVVGVRRHGSDLAAHAWIESDHIMVPMQDVGQYTRLWSTA